MFYGIIFPQSWQRNTSHYISRSLSTLEHQQRGNYWSYRLGARPVLHLSAVPGQRIELPISHRDKHFGGQQQRLFPLATLLLHRGAVAVTQAVVLHLCPSCSHLGQEGPAIEVPRGYPTATKNEHCRVSSTKVLPDPLATGPPKPPIS